MTSLVELGLSNAAAALLLAVVAVLVGLVCRRPALTHALWLLVLLKLVTPPLVHVPVPRGAPDEVAAAPIADRTDRFDDLNEEPPQADDEGGPWPEEEPDAEPPLRVAVTLEEAGPPTAARWAPGWPALLGGAWLTGSAAWFLLASVRLWRFGRLLRLGRPAPRALTRRVERLAGRVGLAWCPPVVLLPGRLAPMVWGVENPLLLLPEQLPEQVEPESLDTLLLHELAHLKRRDHWVRLLEFVALGLYWWLPVAWYARRELREAEEQCCDAWVVRTLPGAGKVYANAIVDALDFLSPAQPEPPLATGLGQVADLKRRLKMIMRGSIPHQLGWSASLVVLALAALLLPVVPSLAQDSGKKVRLREVSADDLERMEQDLKRRMEEMEALRRKMDEVKKSRAAEEERRKAEDANRKSGDARAKAEEAVRKAESIVRDKMREVERKLEGISKDKFKSLKGLKDLSRAAAEGRGNAVIRIEISGMPGEMKDLVEKLQMVLPKDSRVTINIDERGRDRAPRAVVPAPRGEREPREPREARPKEPQKPQKPVPPAKPETRSRSGGDDRRLENLERRLESIMRELESLRREMRRPGGGSGNRRDEAAPDAPPAPGGAR